MRDRGTALFGKRSFSALRRRALLGVLAVALASTWPATDRAAEPATPGRAARHATDAQSTGAEPYLSPHSYFVTEPLTSSGAFQARWIEDRDHVSILELSGGSYDKSNPDGSTNVEPRSVLAREFFSTHPDNYDFLIVFTTFEFNTGEAVAFHLGVRNEVAGIGLPVFDNTSLFGSHGKLQGYIDMAALTRYGADPLAPDFDFALGTLAHEMQHQWCCYVSFRDGGSDSRALLGRDGAHWSYLLDTDASLMYGSDWRPNGNGTFTAVATRSFYSPLDLYLAGFYGAGEVPPATLLVSPGVDATQIPLQGATVTATPRTVSLADVVAAMGPRVPAAAEAQKTFRAAFLMVTRPGIPVTDRQITALNDVRDGLYARFSALTGGRGIVEVYPEARIDGGTGAPDPVGGGPLRPGEANLSDALAWLRGRQSTQGFWEDTPSTRVRDTAVTLGALTSLDAGFSRRAEALSWLTAEPKPSADYRARVAAVQAQLGQDSVALRGELLALQNTDGGWGLGAGFGSVPLDTALAVQALAGRAGVPPAKLAAAVAYLRGAQGADGGWGATPRGSSRTGVTAEVLAALSAAGESAPVEAALAFLAGRQNADGGFGDSPSTAHDTARALLALMSFDALERVDGGRAASYLGTRQSVEGSWEGSVYTTALTVSALRRFAFPNWAFDGAFTVTPAQARDGERVRLAARVVNNGNAFAPAGVLRFYDGDPAAGGVAIGADIALPPLAPLQAALIETLWDTLDHAGLHTLFAVIDPADAVVELSELDNRASAQAEVLPPPAGADLEIRGSDIVVTPSQPQSLPAPLAISVAVRNLGQTAVSAVRVVLRQGEAAGAPIVGELTLAVPARSSVAANFSVTLTTPGTTRYVVEADPDGAVVEADETNNRATATVTTQPAVDLAVAAADVELVGGGPALVGSDVTFRVTLRNRGTLDAPSTEVRYRVTDGTTIRELGTNLIQPAAGQSLVQNLVWRVDLTGPLSFTVEIDPHHSVPETDETNNDVALAFTATTATSPNLAVSFRDLVFVPNPGREGSPLAISVLLRNNGAGTVDDAQVAFYDGDPQQGGSLIDSIQTVPSLPAGSAVTVGISLPEVVGDRDRLIFAVADPTGQVAELDEGDNTAFEPLVVLSLPDLAVAAGGLDLEPRFPRPGQAVTLRVNLANLGEQEATNVTVRVYDGDPAAGGSLAAPEQVIPSIAGHGPAQADFAWTFAGNGAPRPLVVVVDPAGTIRESNEGNNQASLDVAVQDADFFVTERYFSPDGDGVKDSTSLFFRLDPPGDATVRIFDGRGRVVRRSPAFTGVSDGRFDWDGLDDRGRVVRDGDYQLRVVDPAGNLRGQAVASVDTNRSSLIEAIGTQFELFSNLTCELPTVGQLYYGRDEDDFFFYVSPGDPLFGPGLYRMTNTGGDVRQIVPAFWSSGSVYEMAVAPDGTQLAFSFAGQMSSGGPYVTQYWVANADGTGLRQVGENVGTTIYGFSNDGHTLLVSRYDSEVTALDLTGFQGPRTVYSGSSLDSYTAAFSPDHSRLVLKGYGEAPELVLINLETLTGEQLEDFDYDYPTPEFSWSPDGTRLAVAKNSPPEVQIFDRDGHLLLAMPIPIELPPFPLDGSCSECSFADHRTTAAPQAAARDWTSTEAYAAGLAGAAGETRGFYGPSEPELNNLHPPQWASSSTELALDYDMWVGFPTYANFGRVMRFDVLAGESEHVAWKEVSGGESYHVSTWDGSAWQERGVLHFGNRYQEQELDLSDFLPDPGGKFRVRIRQQGREAAHVDSLALWAGELERVAPASAVVLSTGQDVRDRLALPDNEVLDLWGKTVEVDFAPRAADPRAGGRRALRLALTAREEDLSQRNFVPFAYPGDDQAYTYRVTAEGPLVMDGQQTAADGLGEPLFRTVSRPATGHPPGEVSGWVKSDGTDLFGVLDFTVDNTLDGERDWASFEVETADGWRELRVTAADGQHGIAGFTHTAPVRHAHKYYEFRVPLAELGASVGDTLAVRWHAYGTAADCPDGDCEADDEDLLPGFGRLLWVPNERTLYYGDLGYGDPPLAIFLDEDLERRELFSDWFSFGDERFTPSGRRLLFQSSDAANDPNSSCYNRGYSDNFAFSSLANLTVDLRPRRSASSGGILLEGTAADKHFKSYRLEYSTAVAPSSWNPIAPPSAQPVVDGRFTTWVPPGPGTYFVRLTVDDLAGNAKSRIKRIGFSDTPSITDLYRDPEYISPNGDGVQDQTLVHYRVLEPVHLEFQIYDEDGDRVRTMRRDHSVIGAVFEVPWDGRGDNGLPVPDGEYRLVVQDYEFFVHVDATPPAVEIAVANAYQPVFDRATNQLVVAVAPEVSAHVVEKNFLASLSETGQGANPFTWLDFSIPLGLDPDDPDGLLGSRSLQVEEVTDHRFRLSAQDRAGNRALIASPLVDEEVIVYGFGKHGVTPEGGFTSLEKVPYEGVPAFRLTLGDVRFRVAETVRNGTFSLAVQFRQVGQTSWNETRLDRFVQTGGTVVVPDIPPHHLEAIWDMAGIPVGVETEVRLRLVDDQAGEHFSNSFQVLTDGLYFGGLLTRDDVDSGPYADLLRQMLTDAFSSGALQPEDRVLWGVEFVDEPFEEVLLPVTSPDDPRYATPVTLRPAYQTEGGFLWKLDPASPCLTYNGYIRATTVPEPIRRNLVSNGRGVTLACLYIEGGQLPPDYGQCGEPPASQLAHFRVEPVAADGVQLVLMTIGRQLPGGGEDVLYSVNRPASGRSYTFDVDTSDLPEGTISLVGRLSNGEGRTSDTAIPLYVDRTPPAALIQIPHEGQRLCGIPRQTELGLRNVLDVEGRVDDIALSYNVELKRPGKPFAFAQDDIFCYGGPELLWPRPPPARGGPCPSVHGRLATWGDDAGEAEFSGEATARLHVYDRGGFHECREVTFIYDGEVEDAVATASPTLFSPNGDDTLDETLLSVAVGEAARLDVEVFHAVMTNRGPVVTGAPIRSLVSNLQVLDSELLPWNGFDGTGARVADGLYGLVATLTDACGNQAERTAFVEVDATPPQLAISYPHRGDPMPMIVEVHGTATDLHLSGWTLDYGLGTSPDTWARIGNGVREMHDEVLAPWNTNGLAGDVTARLSGRDAAGNQAEIFERLLFTNPVYLLTYAEVVPRLFSPNGDGRRERASLRFGLDSACFVEVAVRNTGGVTVRTLANGGSVLGIGPHALEWDGLNDAGVPVPDGVYTLALRAILGANTNVHQDETLSVILDATPPTIVLTSPNQGFVTGSGAVVGTIDDLHLVEYLVELTDSPDAPAWDEIASGTLPRIATALARLENLEESEHALRVTATDEGEIQSQQIVRFTVDNTRPVVAFTAPSPLAVLGRVHDAHTVSGTVTEDHLDHWRLEVGVGTAPTSWTLISESPALPVGDLLANWAVASLADGPYTLRLSAEDKAGLTAEARLPVVVDNTPPEVELTDPADGAYVIRARQVLGTATDEHFSELKLEVAPRGTQSWQTVATGQQAVAGGLLASWDALPPDGEYQLRLSAHDAADNAATTQVLVTVDLTPPAKPIALTARVVDQQDAQLDWTANHEPDLAGYFVYRDGQKITPTLVPDPHYLDRGLQEGPYVYTVTAVDRAGNESEPSDPARVAVDRTPPTARISTPRNGDTVSGLVDILGTAYSADDFREYRLTVTPVAGGGTQLLRRSPVPVQADVLGPWNTLPLPEGAQYRIRLEAEDLNANVATVEVLVTIDNLPPAAPTGLAGTPISHDAQLTWNANTEPDLAGYLLFRDGRLANATGVVVGDLTPYVIATNSYRDRNLPDGTFTYEVYAIDRAGNLSDPSQSAQVTIDTRPPHAVIVDPEDGTRFGEPLYVLATTVDTDVERVQFQFRRVGVASWTNLGPADTALPWEASLDPVALGLSFDDYEIQAVATDRGGATDPAPTPITVTYTDVTRPDPPLALVTHVDGGDVTVSWTASPSSDVVGYRLYRRDATGSETLLTATPVTATTYLDADLPDSGYVYTATAVDGVENESDRSNEGPALVHTPALEQPYTPTSATVSTLAGCGQVPQATVEGTRANGDTQPLPPATTDENGCFSLADLPLAAGENQLTVRLADADGNRSKPATVHVVVDPPPSPPTGLTAVAATDRVNLDWNPNPEADLRGYRAFRDGQPLVAPVPLAGLSAVASSNYSTTAAQAIDGNPDSYWSPLPPIRDQWIELHWSAPRLVAAVDLVWWSYPGVPPYVLGASDYTLEAWDGEAWVKVAAVAGNSAAENEVVLARPYVTNRVRVKLVTSLLYEYSYQAVRLAEVTVREQPLLASPETFDPVTDGRFQYTVTAVDDYGFESTPSDPAQVEIGDVIPPDAVVLTATVDSADVSLDWTASASPDVASYELFRDGELLSVHTDLGSLHELDAGLPNGTYVYTVRPVDGVGNVGALSNLAPATVAVPVPEAPIALTVTVVPTGGALDLAWQPGAGPPAVAYRVYRGTTPGGPYDGITDTDGLALRDVDVVNGVTYFYVVKALDAIGNESASSNEASGTPADSVAAAAPFLHWPGYPNRVFETGAPSTDVGGSAEPGASVELFRGGRSLGRTTAHASTEAAFTGIYGGRFLSPDGRFLATVDVFTPVIHDYRLGEDLVPGNIPSYSRSRWFPDSQSLAILDEDGGISRFTVETQALAPITRVNFAELALPSPDGHRLAVLGYGDSGYGLYLYDLASDQWTLTLADPYWWFDAQSFVWSPDGSRLAYLRYSPVYALEVLDLATGNETAIDSDPGDGRIQFSFDGGAVVYSAHDSATGEIAAFRTDLESGARERLTSGWATHPQLSPDGRSLLYLDDSDEAAMLDLASGEVASLAEILGPVSWNFTEWTQSGHLVLSTFYEQMRITPAGFFELRAQPLDPGDNTFTAQARDAAGNLGPASEPMVVRVGTAARPDLVISSTDLVVLPPVAQTAQTVRLSVTVRNLGEVAAPASDLSLVVSGPGGFLRPLIDGPAIGALAPGASQTVTRDLALGPMAGTYTASAAADPVARIAESDETNNRAQRSFAAVAPGVPLLEVATDRTLYTAGDPVQINLRVTNGGDPFTGEVRLAIVDADGFLVEELPPVPVVDLAFGASVTATRPWSSAGIFAGDYRVVAHLDDAGGNEIANASAGFVLGATVQLAAQVATDRGTYQAGATVAITGSVQLVGGNATVSGAVARLSLLDAGGNLVTEWEQPLADLLPDGEATVRVDWPSTGADLGDYRVALVVLLDGEAQASAETFFALTAAAVQVAGDLTLDDRTPALGTPLGVAYSVTNLGSGPLPDLPFAIAVVDPASGAVVASVPRTADLGPGASTSGTVSFETTGLRLGNYLAVLSATVPAPGGSQVITLKVASFTTIDEDPPVVTLVEPPAGALVGASPLARVRATDALSLVHSVEVQVDGGTWQGLPAGDPTANLYEDHLAGLAEGPHVLRARATDTYGNTGEAPEVPFTVDTTPPLITITGVEPGGVYLPPVAPTITIVEEHPGTQSITLSGVPYVSGTPIPADGSYVLLVTATDAAGNHAERSVAFTLASPRTLAIADVSVAEGNGSATSATFVVSLSGVAAQPVTVSYATADVTATAGADYTATTGMLTIAAGSTTGTITVPVLGDLLDEADETFRVTLTSPQNATLGDGEAVGTIVDDDGAPSLSIADVSVTEGNSGSLNAVFTVTLSTATTFPVTVSYATSNVTATAGADYTAATGTLTIPAGSTTGTITVPVLGDLLDEADETFRVTLTNPMNATLGDGEALGTIVDDDSAPSLTIADVSVTEGNSGSVNAVFTVTLSTATTFPVTVSYATADVTATAGTDYTATTGTLTIPAGSTTGTITVPVLGDLLDEADETFRVTLTNPQNATLGDGEALGTIVDDDGAPALSIADVSVTEGNSGSVNAVFTVTLSTATTFPVTVSYATSNVTATAGTDYTATSGTLTIAAGSTTGTITVPVLGDVLDEADETFRVPLTNPQNATLGDGEALGTIVDDDGAPSLAIADVSVTEGNSGSVNAIFTVTLSSATTFPVTVSYATADVTATAGADYTATTGTLTIPAGSTTGTITVPVLGDVVDEADETFRVTLTNPQNATLGDGEAVGTIVDDDGAPALSIADVSVTEGNSGSLNAVFTVTLSTATTFPVTVSYATSNVTATAGTDYTATTGTLTIAAGSTTGTITVPVLGDVVDEADETFRVTLTNPQNATLGDGEAVGTIDDDDVAAGPTLSINDVSVNEGNSGVVNAVFTVTLSAASPVAVQVSFATANVTATAGADYTAVSGVLTIPAGSTTGKIVVPVLGDLFDEVNETFRATLSNPQNATIADGEGIGTILDDDAGEFCPHSAGYWKNHPESWPAQQLTLGGVLYHAAGLLDLLSYGGSDQATHVARQLVATKLNLLSGSDPSVQTLVDLADDFLADYPPGSNPQGSAGDDAKKLMDDLEKYNVDPVCEDEPWQYTNSTELSGLGAPGNKDGGLVFCDFNNDGWLDVLANVGRESTSTTATGKSYLYYNYMDGTFTDVTGTHAAGLKRRRGPLSAICGDLDKNGTVDFARNNANRIEVYLNRGAAATPPYSFGDANQDPNQVITTIPGGMNTEGMAFLDFDHDGDLDLMVNNGTAGVDLFTNNGLGVFTHATPDASPRGLPIKAKTGDYATAADWNADGWVDFLARLEDKADLWRNQGDGSFVAVAGFDQKAVNTNKGGATFCDLDHDGDLDLVWTDAPLTQIWRNQGTSFQATGLPRFLCHSGDDDDDAWDDEECPEYGEEDIDGVACADVDNDGDLDLFFSGVKKESFLFLNITPAGGALAFDQRRKGIDVKEIAREAAFGDVDHDGDLDLAISVDGKENQLWESHANDGRSDAYLEVRALRCLGNQTYRDDLGAAIRLFETDGVTPVSPLQQVNGGRGHGSQDAAPVHFGLPEGADREYVVEVRFQATGAGSGPVARARVTPAALTGYNLIEVKSCIEANLPPIAYGQSVGYRLSRPVAIDLAGSDPEGHPLTYVLVTAPARGALSGSPPHLLYTPAHGQTSSEQFRFLVSDGETESAPVTVTLQRTTSASTEAAEPAAEIFEDSP